LAPVTEDRDRALPLPEARDVLGALSRRLSLVAVVSGRPVEYLRAQLGGVPGLILVGLYGLEREEGGQLWLDPAALAWGDEIGASADAAEREAPDGVEVERKGLGPGAGGRHRFGRSARPLVGGSPAAGGHR
jgi:trehalose 6-phosphate phosphatase